MSGGYVLDRNHEVMEFYLHVEGRTQMDDPNSLFQSVWIGRRT
jgi:hypothetical protein